MENPEKNPAPALDKKIDTLQADPMAELFTSRFLKVVVLLMMILFNMAVLRNSFLLLAPSLNFSGSTQLDALFYGAAISTFMMIVLFHEEKWDNFFCPGAMVLYFNILILVFYMNWLEWLIGKTWTLLLMGSLLAFAPVLSLFVIVIMLKAKRT